MKQFHAFCLMSLFVLLALSCVGDDDKVSTREENNEPGPDPVPQPGKTGGLHDTIMNNRIIEIAEISASFSGIGLEVHSENIVEQESNNGNLFLVYSKYWKKEKVINIQPGLGLPKEVVVETGTSSKDLEKLAVFLDIPGMFSEEDKVLLLNKRINSQITNALSLEVSRKRKKSIQYDNNYHKHTRLTIWQLMEQIEIFHGMPGMYSLKSNENKFISIVNKSNKIKITNRYD